MQTDIIEGFELSPQQKHVWLLQPTSLAYRSQLAILIEGPLKVKVLKKAFLNLSNRHEILRTTFHSVPDLKFPIQRVSDRPNIQWQEIDLSSWSIERQQIFIEERFQQEGQSSFNLEQGPLVRLTLLTLATCKYTLLIALPAFYADTKTLRNIVQQISLLYAKNEHKLEKIPIQYIQFSAWQNEIITEKDTVAGTGYWQNQKIINSLNLKLPFELQPVTESEFQPQSLSITLCPKLVARIEAFVQKYEISTSIFFLTCFSILLSRHTQQSDIIIGSLCDNRSYEGLEDAIGLFAKYLPVHCSLKENFITTVEQIEASNHEAQAWLEYFDWEQTVGLDNFDACEFSLFCFEFEHQIPSYKANDIFLTINKKYASSERFKVKLSCLEQEDILTTEFHYDSNLFSLLTIERLAGQYQTLLESVVSNPEKSISELQILSTAERQQLLLQWNNTQVDYPQDKCIHQLFEAQTEQTPDAIAVIFESKQLTYQELNSRANQLAHYLRSLKVGKEVLVGICVERSLEMVVGVLGILKAGGAYVPLDPKHPLERLAFMLADAQVSVLLTQQELIELPKNQTKVIYLDSDSEAIAQQSQLNPVSETTPENLAYVIYTSGSTGVPKGVLLTHKNVTRLFAATESWFHFNQQDVWTLFHSIAFDFSVWELWGALLYGGRLVVVPYWLSRSPVAFYDLLCKQQVTVLNQTPAAFRQLIQAEALGTAKELRLRWVIFGGEALNIQSLKPWFERHGDRSPSLVNMYGITETTVHVTYRPLLLADLNITGRPIGRPIPDLQVYVLDQHQQPVPIGVAGEIYVGGAGLARGYLNQADLNTLKFIANPFCHQQNERIYSSGDIARFLPNGELEYLGRIDNQVKVRGFRIELGEIEVLLTQHPAVRETVVVAQEDGLDNKQLVAYIVPNHPQTPTPSELRSYLNKQLPDYMVPSAFVLLDVLPLTSNGKVDRSMLPAPDTACDQLEEAFVAPDTPLERVLAEIWARVLHLERVGIDDNFFALGGDSIRSIQIQSLSQQRGLNFSIEQLFQHQTIHKLAKNIITTHAVTPTTQVQRPSLICEEDQLKLPDGVEDAYPLSKLQMGMFFHSEYDVESATYHDIFSYHIQAFLAPQALHGAIQQLGIRHQILRTCFNFTEFSEPLQLVYPQVNMPLQVEDIHHLSATKQDEVVAAWIESEKKRHFDWTKPPLLRFQIHSRTEETFQFSLSFHHAILDGWSVASMLTDLFQIYFNSLGKKVPLIPPPPISTFRDFIALERKVIESQECRDYWIEKLRDNAIINLPRWPSSKRVTSHNQVFTTEVLLSPGVSEGLQRLSQTENVTLKSVLLAAHMRVLSLLSAQADIITGLVSNGRLEELDSERVLGLFLNTLPLRMKLTGGTWVELVQSTFKAEQELLPFRRYPLAELQGQLGNQPLFETAFNFVHFHVYQGVLELENIQILETKFFEATNFNFVANFGKSPSSSQVTLHLSYKTTEFCEEQIQTIGGYYARTLAAMVSNPSESYEHDSLLSLQEQHQLLVEWNDQKTQYPQDKCLHQLFEAQVEQQENAIAVVFVDAQLTYQQLNQRANQLAHHLQKLGVTPEVKVGICVERSLSVVVGILGILKAGGAYVPLDPSYPQERLAFIMQDAQVEVLLTEQQLVKLFADRSVKVVCLDTDWEVIAQQRQENLVSACTVNNLSYIIYTSGSTGQPKGVLVTHENVTRLFAAVQHWFDFNQQDVWTLFHSIAFDFSVWEFWGALVYGGRLVVVPYWLSRSPQAFYNLLCTENVTVLNQTPSAFHQLIQAEESCGAAKELALRLVIFGGEALEIQSLKPWFERHGDRFPQLVNMYGITETTVHVTYHPLTIADLQVTSRSVIGCPIPDVQVYLLDQNQQPVPMGSKGEIHISGASLARGYLLRPELTALKFIPNPFSNKPNARLYKSGDLARYLPNGNIEYLGRIDDQVKIRGFRIELGEIEGMLARHPAVRETVVLAKETQSGDKHLVAYVISRNEQIPTTSELRNFLRKQLPNYMVPSVFVMLEALPLTSNGKVNQKALPEPTTARPQLDEVFVAPRTELEKILAEIWVKVLGVERVGIHDDFFALGGDSIRSIQVRSLAQERGLNFSLQQMFQHQTIYELILNFTKEPISVITQVQAFSLISEQDRLKLPDDVEDAYPLTMLQMGMLFHSEYNSDVPVYHNVNSLHLQAVFNRQNFQKAVEQLVARHPVLRTSFDLSQFSAPLQLVHRNAVVPLQVEDLRHLFVSEQQQTLNAKLEAEKYHKFDLTRAPLLRFQIYRRSEKTFQFCFTEHHAILDGWSVAAMLAELFESYFCLLNGEAAAIKSSPAIAFRDFVDLHFKALQSRESQQYWNQLLKDSTKITIPRWSTMHKTGHTSPVRALEVSISYEISAGLQKLAQMAKVPLKSVLVAAHVSAIAQLSAQSDVVTILSSNGRLETTDGDWSLGLFLTPLPLRMKLSCGTWIDLAQQIFAAERDFLPYRWYPLAQIQRNLGSQRLSEIAVNFTHFHVYERFQKFNGLQILDTKSFQMTDFVLVAEFSLDVFSSELKLCLICNTSELCDKQIEKIGQDYAHTLAIMAKDPTANYILPKEKNKQQMSSLKESQEQELEKKNAQKLKSTKRQIFRG